MAPRFSIIPGSFAEDQRADVAHFRVLNLIGRHTDEDGWCRLKQITIGDGVGLTRECVNRKIKDLVAWGYVEKDARDSTGRSIWYRTILDRPLDRSALTFEDNGEDQDASETHSSNGDAGPVNGGSYVEYNSDGPVIATDHTWCDRTQSHITTSSTSSPPYPPAGGDSAVADLGRPADNLSAGAIETLRKLKAERPRDAAVAAVIEPLFAARRFSAADPVKSLAEACSAMASFSPAHHAKVLELLLKADVRVVKAERLMATVEAVKRGGLMLVIAKGSAEFSAWHRYLEGTTPNLAQTMARSDKWQVPTPWPPKKTEANP